MNLLPNGRTQLGHRRAHSTALETCTHDLKGPIIEEYEQESTDNQTLLEDKIIVVPRQKPRIDNVFILLWSVSVALTWLCTYLWTQKTGDDQLGSFGTGFVTDLRAARSSIQTLKQRFYGSLDFNGHHGFIPSDSPSLAYVGSGPEVDEAWEVLTKDRYFLLTDSEASDAYGSNIDKYWNVHHGGWIAGLDVLHTLHCLDHLRMSIYPDVYPQDPIDGPMHKAHCVDHLRQLVMCNGDLTPVPTQYFEGLERNYINSSREHTCRDFWEIREWATDRFNGSTAVKPRNRDGESIHKWQQILVAAANIVL